MKIKTVFGKVLKQTREAKGISQEKLATLACLHKAYIYKLEANKSLPSILVFMKLASALKISPKTFWSKIENSLQKIPKSNSGGVIQ